MSAGVPFLLHACGDLSLLMDDLIESVAAGAMHSFENRSEVVESLHGQYGQRMALLGGMDVDLLARGSKAQGRAHTWQLLDTLGPSGIWGLGAGNSVTIDIPVANYLAMLDEGRRWNRERYGSR